MTRNQVRLTRWRLDDPWTFGAIAAANAMRVVFGTELLEPWGRTYRPASGSGLTGSNRASV